MSITINTNDQTVELDPQVLDEFIRQNGIAKLRKLFFIDAVKKWLEPLRDWIVDCFNEKKTRLVCSQEIQKVAPRFLEPPLPFWICMLLGVCDMEIPEVIKDSHHDYRFKERQIRSWQSRDWEISQKIHSDMRRENQKQKKLFKGEKSAKPTKIEQNATIILYNIQQKSGLLEEKDYDEIAGCFANDEDLLAYLNRITGFTAIVDRGKETGIKLKIGELQEAGFLPKESKPDNESAEMIELAKKVIGKLSKEGSYKDSIFQMFKYRRIVKEIANIKVTHIHDLLKKLWIVISSRDQAYFFLSRAKSLGLLIEKKKTLTQNYAGYLLSGSVRTGIRTLNIIEPVIIGNKNQYDFCQTDLSLILERVEKNYRIEQRLRSQILTPVIVTDLLDNFTFVAYTQCRNGDFAVEVGSIPVELVVLSEKESVEEPSVKVNSNQSEEFFSDIRDVYQDLLISPKSIEEKPKPEAQDEESFFSKGIELQISQNQLTEQEIFFKIISRLIKEADEDYELMGATDIIKNVIKHSSYVYSSLTTTTSTLIAILKFFQIVETSGKKNQTVWRINPQRAWLLINSELICGNQNNDSCRGELDQILSKPKSPKPKKDGLENLCSELEIIRQQQKFQTEILQKILERIDNLEKTN